jgi:antitoxin (DNA-binding transcriptional repressor) of toxin-antitoxin stability system
MYEIELDKAKPQLEILIQMALNGEEVIITRNDEPILKLTSISKPAKYRKAGSAKGMITVAKDFDEPLEDFRDYM